MPVGEVLVGHRLQVEPRVARELAQRQPLGLQRGDDLLLEDLLVEQVLDADPEPRGLVGVAGADAAAGGADLQLAELDLARVVEQHVVGHDQVRVGRDPQRAGVDVAAAQIVELVGQDLRVDHDPVADHAQLARVQDARRHQVQLPGLAVADDRVAGVVAALEADDRVRPLGEQVGDLALAFVAPLGADDHDSRHFFSSVGARGHAAPRDARPDPLIAVSADPQVHAVVVAQHRQLVAHLGQARDGALGDLLAERLAVEDVRRDHDRALLLVAGVDDRVELLEHPRRRLLGADVVDVQQVDGDEPLEQVVVRAGVEGLADLAAAGRAASSARPSARPRAPPW